MDSGLISVKVFLDFEFVNKIQYDICYHYTAWAGMFAICFHL